MINLIFGLTFFNILNLIFGIIFGFLFMVMITCAILSKVLSKYNKDSNIREVSKRAYADFYLKKDGMKDKIVSAILYEIKEVSQQCYPDKKYPFYELSINEIIGGLLILQGKLKRFVNHPLCKDLKNVHIATILSLESNIKPVMNMYHKKPVKLLYKSFKLARMVFNVINPIFYIKKIMSWTVFRKGQKDIVIICLDFIGNCCYEIYTIEKNNTTSTLNDESIKYLEQ